MRWRVATTGDDDAIVAMCLALYEEDPGEPVDAAQIRRTLAAFRAAPVRGRAVVAEDAGVVGAYAFLFSFWSNEYGGESCVIDELYVAPPYRGRGLGSSLFAALPSLWPGPIVVQALEVHPGRDRARALYERLGFREGNALLRRRSPTG